MNKNKNNFTAIDNLVAETRDIIRKDTTRHEKLMDICMLLHEKVDKFDWVGFYLADPDADRELILGPYVGDETSHTRIPFGTGICGQAADTLETFVIDDVEVEGNYLSCGAAVKSEIVIPLMKEGLFIGELDIDSHKKAAITKKDQEVLEEISKLVAGLY
ncbi:MAG: GAF domain-containing protein [Balneolales bacterium]